MSEYGFQAFPDLSTIATFADPADFRIDSPVMKAHQKFLAGEGNDRITFYLKQNLRDPRDFADLVYLSQAMQARAMWSSTIAWPRTRFFGARDRNRDSTVRLGLPGPSSLGCSRSTRSATSGP